MQAGAPSMRLVAAVIVALFSLSATRVTSGASRTCAGRCPVDCPMHVKRLGCHHGKAAVTPAHDCHRRADATCGLRRPGCQHGPDGLANSLPPAILPWLLDLHEAAQVQRYPLNDPLAPAMVIVEPPFRPPPVLALS
jgi:hypothetical protein